MEKTDWFSNTLWKITCKTRVEPWSEVKRESSVVIQRVKWKIIGNRHHVEPINFNNDLYKVI